jgi:hypothetical protein
MAVKSKKKKKLKIKIPVSALNYHTQTEQQQQQQRNRRKRLKVTSYIILVLRTDKANLNVLRERKTSDLPFNTIFVSIFFQNKMINTEDRS